MLGRNCSNCTEPFDDASRRRVECPQCKQDACRTCCQYFFLASAQEPSCMHCLVEFKLMHLVANFSDTFWTEFKAHRETMCQETMCLGHERSPLVPHRGRQRRQKPGKEQVRDSELDDECATDECATDEWERNSKQCPECRLTHLSRVDGCEQLVCGPNCGSCNTALLRTTGQRIEPDGTKHGESMRALVDGVGQVVDVGFGFVPFFGPARDLLRAESTSETCGALVSLALDCFTLGTASAAKVAAIGCTQAAMAVRAGQKGAQLVKTAQAARKAANVASACLAANAAVKVAVKVASATAQVAPASNA